MNCDICGKEIIYNEPYYVCEECGCKYCDSCSGCGGKWKCDKCSTENKITKRIKN